MNVERLFKTGLVLFLVAIQLTGDLGMFDRGPGVHVVLNVIDKLSEEVAGGLGRLNHRVYVGRILNA